MKAANNHLTISRQLRRNHLDLRYSNVPYDRKQPFGKVASVEKSNVDEVMRYL
jgi:hypothetical protein